PARQYARCFWASGSSWRDSGPIDRKRAVESERVSRRAITRTWHRRWISWIAAVTAVTRRKAGTESTHTSAEAAAAHRHSSAEQPRENRRQHVRRGAVVLLILLILALGLVGLRTGRFVVLIILDRAGRGVRIGAIGRNSVDRRSRAAPAASQFRADLDPVVHHQRRILQIVASLLLGVSLAEVGCDEAKQNHLLAAARTGDDLRTDQRQRVMLQIIRETLALRRIDRAAGNGARARWRRQTRTGTEAARGPQRRRFRRTGAVGILHGHA